jgi:RimJ/RimL family protein N-acetyltransferase
MASRLRLDALSHKDIAELENVLRNEEVYRYIGGAPSTEDFWLGHERAISGPPPSRASEVWINFTVRLQETRQVLGRLEATIHNGIAEVAFLFSPSVWGLGYATEGLLMLHSHLASLSQPPVPWATTVQPNVRAQALLYRSGYKQVPYSGQPNLLTFDEGDLVYTVPHAA